jgi:acetate kinase
MNVLVLNSGSSSLKFQLIATDMDRIHNNADQRLCKGEIEGIGGETKITAQIGTQPRKEFTASLADITAAVGFLVSWMVSGETGIPEVKSNADIHAAGHRVVHGGEKFSESAVITDEVLKGIEDCVELAPLHNPGNIKGIQAIRKIFGPKLPQVAVFDTAFHHKLPECAFLYAIPYHLYERDHIRRYGFHGTSHRYVSYRFRVLTNKTREQTHVITLHLGNGCSAAAIRNGYPVDTSMGMTPLEGLVMGTRSGDLDPAVVSLIAAKEGLKLEDVETLLNTKSGLLGISGVSNDMRTLQQKSESERRARLAIEVFCYRARKYIGAYLAAMEGADAVVFTGGIGENSAEVRGRICEGLGWLGLRLDKAANEQPAKGERRISAEDSKPHAYVIPTDEELLIARDTVRCILGEPHPS